MRYETTTNYYDLPTPVTNASVAFDAETSICNVEWEHELQNVAESSYVVS